MGQIADRDGKSKTASAVDEKHYPGPGNHEGEGVEGSKQAKKPKSSNAPETGAKLEHEAADKSKALLKQVNKQSGSVQR